MKVMPRLASVVGVVAVSLATLSSSAFPQGTGRSMDIDVSIRSAGMAGASNAVFWGDALDHWANPALLGYQTGLRYEWGRTQLVPGLAENIYLTSRVLKAGGGGAGVVLSQQPLTDGGVHLDYGATIGTDKDGNPTRTPSPYEQVDSWGFGVSLAQAFENFSRFIGREPRALGRYLDVSLGMNFKKIDIALAPWTTYGRGGTRARDLGGLVRITPLDCLNREVGIPARIDLAYGYSTLSYNDDAVVTFSGADFASRVTRHRRHGAALRLAANPPGTQTWLRDRAAMETLLGGLLPLITVGVAHDHAIVDAGSGTSAYSADGTGFEIDLAHVLTYRVGSYTDKTGEIDGSTSGWSVGLPVGPWAGVRFERARFPQARDSGLRDLKRKAFSAWVDPAAIWRSFRRTRSR